MALAAVRHTQDDDVEDDDGAEEVDVVEQKVAEEHEKFLAAQAKRQEEVSYMRGTSQLLATCNRVSHMHHPGAQRAHTGLQRSPFRAT